MGIAAAAESHRLGQDASPLSLELSADSGVSSVYGELGTMSPRLKAP